jgi:hypothetical protein
MDTLLPSRVTARVERAEAHWVKLSTLTWAPPARMLERMEKLLPMCK